MPTVLIVAASPLDQHQLRLGNEVMKIKEARSRSRNRENWTIETNEAVTVDGLRRALLDFRPTVVHFSGHGGGASGLAFENDDGNTHAANTAPLTKLFHHFKDTLKCVVLNACYSEVQATEICKQIDYVVGMSRGIGDEPAIKFAVAFYDAVFAATTFRQAFDIACTSIDLNNLPDHDVPVLLTGPSLGNTMLNYTARIPMIEDGLLTYFNAPFEERYVLTTKGEAIREKMSRFYGDQLHAVIDKVTVVSARQIDNDHWKVRSMIYFKGGSASVDQYIRLTDRSIQIEWEASVGYWSMPPKTYLALGTQQPIVARVHASLGKSYYGKFSDNRKQFQSVDLRTQASIHMYGYIHRTTPDGKKLIALLSDGNRRDVTLLIRNVSEETDEALIHALLSDSWLFDGEIQAT